MKHGIEELLTFRTKERDRFEAECHRLRRERDAERLQLQWYTALMCGYGFLFNDNWANIAVEILRSLWPDGPKDSIAFLVAVRTKVKQAHCEHPDSAMDIKSNPVATLVCNDCKAEAIVTGVMTRLLEEEKNAPEIIHAPATIFVNGIQIGTIRAGELTTTRPPMGPIRELRRVETAEDLVRTFGTPGVAFTRISPPPASIPVTPAPESAGEGVAPDVTHHDECICADCMHEAALEGCRCGSCVDRNPF